MPPDQASAVGFDSLYEVHFLGVTGIGRILTEAPCAAPWQCGHGRRRSRPAATHRSSLCGRGTNHAVNAVSLRLLMLSCQRRGRCELREPVRGWSLSSLSCIGRTWNGSWCGNSDPYPLHRRPRSRHGCVAWQRYRPGCPACRIPLTRAALRNTSGGDSNRPERVSVALISAGD